MPRLCRGFFVGCDRMKRLVSMRAEADKKRSEATFQVVLTLPPKGSLKVIPPPLRKITQNQSKTSILSSGWRFFALEMIEFE